FRRVDYRLHSTLSSPLPSLLVMPSAHVPLRPCRPRLRVTRARRAQRSGFFGDAERALMMRCPDVLSSSSGCASWVSRRSSPEIEGNAGRAAGIVADEPRPDGDAALDGAEDDLGRLDDDWPTGEAARMLDDASRMAGARGILEDESRMASAAGILGD